MQNARLDEAQAGVKIAEQSINSLRYADGTTLMAESEEELKRLLMKLKEESEKSGLKLNIEKTKTMTNGLPTSWQIEGIKVEAVTDFIFFSSSLLSAIRVISSAYLRLLIFLPAILMPACASSFQNFS